MAELFLASKTWYLISFIIFVIGAWKFGRKAFTDMLDSRIETIKKEIETAESLRIEAQELLAQYQRKYRDAMSDADDIIERASQNAGDIKKQALADLEDQMKRAEDQHKDRLELMKQEAIQEIRAHAAHLAIEGTRKIISDQIDRKGQDRLVEQSIGQINKSLN